MSIIAVIPAIDDCPYMSYLLDKPMIEWSLECARSCRVIDRILLATNNREVGSLADKWNAIAVFTNQETNEMAVLDALSRIWAKVSDHVFVLSPSYPLRDHNDCTNAFHVMHNVEGVISAIRLNDVFGANLLLTDTENTNIVAEINGPVLLSSNSFYLTQVGTLERERSPLKSNLRAYEVPFWRAFQVKTEQDLVFAHVFADFFHQK